MPNQPTDHGPAAGYCLDCGAGLARGPRPADDCPQCGRPFSWADEDSWAGSYWGSKAAARQLGAAAAALTVVFALGAVQSGSLRWVAAFVVAGLITAKLAKSSLR